MHVGGAIIEGGDADLLADLDEFGILYLAMVVGVIQEEQHGGLFVDGAFQFGARRHFHHLDPGVADGVVIREAVALLNDDFVLHTRQVGDLVHLLAVGAGQHACGAKGKGGGGAGRHHGGRRAHQFGDALAHRVMQLVHLDKILGGVVDCLHHLRAHQGTGMGGVGAGGVDERPDLELGQQIALWHCRCG